MRNERGAAAQAGHDAQGTVVLAGCNAQGAVAQDGYNERGTAADGCNERGAVAPGRHGAGPSALDSHGAGPSAPDSHGAGPSAPELIWLVDKLERDRMLRRDEFLLLIRGAACGAAAAATAAASAAMAAGKAKAGKASTTSAAGGKTAGGGAGTYTGSAGGKAWGGAGTYTGGAGGRTIWGDAGKAAAVAAAATGRSAAGEAATATAHGNAISNGGAGGRAAWGSADAGGDSAEGGAGPICGDGAIAGGADAACAAAAHLFERARAARHAIYGRDIYMRGLIEFTNYCENDCLYCGIRKSNARAERYRLTKSQILACCGQGHELGFRTFVLQGGEDGWFTDERMADIVRAIRRAFPDCAVTLSLGERSRASYQALFDAGAERYLLRHETANEAHYRCLHPARMSLRERKQCLRDLKDIGYQVGCGFMVGSPGQTADCIVDDLFFIKELDPQMVGIGPFIPHRDTPFAHEPAGSLGLTLLLLGVLRLMLPNALLPATTALGTIHGRGRELGALAGANVVMPNLSPAGVRGKYLLYDNKICTGDEAAECRHCMEARMRAIGGEVAVARGDCAGFEPRPPAAAAK